MNIHFCSKSQKPIFLVYVYMVLFFLTISSYVSAAPDLAITDSDVIATPDVAQIGQEVFFTVDVLNIGDQPSSKTYLELDLTKYGNPSDVLWVGIANVPSLEPNESILLDIPGGTGYPERWKPGSYAIYIAPVSIDPERLIPDGNRDNNIAGTSVQCGLPDLELVSINVKSTPNPPSAGESVTIEAIVRNNNPDGPYPTYVECEINRYGQPAGSPPIFTGTHEFTINGNETLTVEIDTDWIPAQNWAYIIAVVVDPPYLYPDYEHDHGDIIETNDTYKDEEGIHFGNNALWTSTQVGTPDFEVVDVRLISDSYPPRIGEPVTIEVDVRNNSSDGPYPTYVACEINRYRASEGDPPIWEGSHEFTINGYETITVTMDEAWTPTENWIYIIAVIVDPPYSYPDYEHDHGDIIETNDTYKDEEGIHFGNNALWTSIQVGTPDFEVVDVRLISDSHPPRTGEPVIIEVDVRNNSPDGPYPTYVACEINLFRAPEDSLPVWTGASEFTIYGIDDGIRTVTIKDVANGDWVPTAQDLYIISVIIDPPYYHPDYEHEHGDIIEIKDTYVDEGVIQFANNALWISCCVYDTVPPDPGNAHSWLSANLVRDQEGGPGYLLRSFGVDSCLWNAYAYDQALGIIAFTALGDFTSARKILDELEYLQEEEGSFIFVWHAPRPKSVDLMEPGHGEKRMAGTNAWIVMAVNLYTICTQDGSYLEMAEECADWILTLQDDDGGIFGGYGDRRIFKPDGKVNWKSVEHNLDAYSALYFLSQSLPDRPYAEGAQKVKDWLYSCWIDEEGRFRRGAGLDENGNLVPDNYMTTDTNTWGILALGETGPNGEDFTRGLQWCLDNTLLWETYERCDGQEVNVCGFDVNLDGNSDYDDNPVFVKGGSHTGDGLDTVWMEGTLGFVISCLVIKDYENYCRFLNEMRKTQCTNGGVPYSTSFGSAGEYITDRDGGGFVGDGYDDTDRTTTSLSVAGTAWYIMTEQQVNPFQPCQTDQIPQPVELMEGWNLFSLYVQPDNTSVESVLSPVWEKYDSICTYESSSEKWLFHSTASPAFLNDLLEVKPGVGYWIRMKKYHLLLVHGAEAADHVQLYSGWNLVGYTSRNTRPIEDCMRSIEGKYSSVWAYDPYKGWLCHIPGGAAAISNLKFMQPGRGYIIYVEEPCIWDID